MGRTRSALIVIALLLAATVVSAAAPASTTFDYPKAKVDTNDFSFYQPPVSTEPYPLTSARKIRNVIFCIGDGMGVSQVALTRMKAVGTKGKLHMERLPVSGLIRTHSADALVTDSAAAGTALASGIKTKNGMIGMTPDEKAYGTLLEAAQAKGMASGLVVTSAITHATPASFAAHVKSRNMEAKIAEHLIANKVNVLLGGGRKFFLPKSATGSGRKDDTDLIAAARKAGYLYVQSAEEMRATQYPYLLGLFQLEALTTQAPEPTLAAMTDKAIRILKHNKRDASGKRQGFFLMVEGSQIDWACHDNNANNCIRQTLLFDEAVKVAVDFALADGRTLVIVTADHETGGLTIPGGSLKGTDAKAKWSTKSHTGSPVAIYAMGPRAEIFGGVYDNTEVAKKLAQLLGVRPFPQPLE